MRSLSQFLGRGIPKIDHDLLLIVLGLKLLLFLFGPVCFLVLEDRPLSSVYEALKLWARWDAVHYLDIAEHGYVAEESGRHRIGFFPLFILLARGLARRGAAMPIVCASSLLLFALFATQFCRGRWAF